MEIIDQFTEGKFPEKNIVLIFLLILFISGIALIISGVKIPSENKAAKIISILLGILLIIITFLSAIYVVLFGMNFWWKLFNIFKGEFVLSAIKTNWGKQL